MENIKLRLNHTRLSESPHYKALSYAWGDPTKSRRVFCEGRFIEVTESLFTALRRLRCEDEEMIIWADAICINQGVVVEKLSNTPLY